MNHWVAFALRHIELRVHDAEMASLLW